MGKRARPWVPEEQSGCRSHRWDAQRSWSSVKSTQGQVVQPASQPHNSLLGRPRPDREGLCSGPQSEGRLLWGGLPRPGFLHTVLKIVFLSDPRPFGDWVESTEQNWDEKGIQGTWGVSAAPQICFSFTLWVYDFTSSLSSWMWSWTRS